MRALAGTFERLAYNFDLMAGIDIEFARNEEEQIMLRDIKAWYDGTSVKENIHPKTGATPLHVAAAKGYQDIMR
jgi:protein phosphatase 1 regulatory subunit 12A